MISQFVRSSPTLGSMLTVQSLLEFSLSLSLSLSAPCLLSPLSLQNKTKYIYIYTHTHMYKKVYSLISFEHICILINHHHCQDTEHIHHPQKSLGNAPITPQATTVCIHWHVLE